MNDTKRELDKLTDAELVAYNRICEVSLRCLQSREDRELTADHLAITDKLILERAQKLVDNARQRDRQAEAGEE